MEVALNLSRRRIAIIAPFGFFVLVGLFAFALLRTHPLAERFDRVADGMSQAEVVAIMGPPASRHPILFQTPNGFVPVTSLEWDNANGDVHILIENDVVISKY